MRHLGIFYFLLFASVGVYAPWMPPLLEHRGLTAAGIGLALAAVAVSRAILPPIWGLVADRARSKRAILAVTAVLAGSALTSLMLDWPPDTIIVVLFVYGFFLVPVVPLAEVLTLGALGGERERYGRIRLWGSLGFILTSVGLGGAIDRLGIHIVPLAAGLPLILAGLSAARAPETTTPRMLDWRQAVRGMPWRRILPVLLATALGQASHGPYYAYFTLQMTERGVAPVSIGLLWAWGVVAEIVLMAASPRLFRRIGLAAALRWALILALLRWAAFAAEPSVWVVALVQTLHAASFGLMHLAAVQLIDDHAPPHSKALGQTILSATVYGLGVGGGLALAGRLFDRLWYTGLYAGAALLCVVGFGAAILVRAKARPPAPRA